MVGDRLSYQLSYIVLIQTSGDSVRFESCTQAEEKRRCSDEGGLT